MEGWMWLILACMFLAGGVFGAVFARSKKTTNTQKVDSLESSLTDARSELEDYQKDVAQHFSKTAELFDTLTNDYRAVHEHLATSSEALCGDQAAKLGPSMPSRRLDDAPEEEAKTTAPEAETKIEEKKVADETTEEVSTEQVASSEESTDETKEETIATEESTTPNMEEKAAEARTIH